MTRPKSEQPVVVGKRREALAVGAVRYFNGKPCRRGHIAERYSRNAGCVQCADLDASNGRSAKYLRKKDRILAQHKAYRLADPERTKRQRRVEYEKHRERYLDQAAHWQRNNPDKVRVRNQKWATKNPEKTRALVRTRRARRKAAEGAHTGPEIVELFERQRGRCANSACRTSIKKGYHADHIVALVRGGTNWISNIQLLCPTCNLRKGQKDPIDFARQNGLLL